MPSKSKKKKKKTKAQLSQSSAATTSEPQTGKTNKKKKGKNKKNKTTKSKTKQNPKILPKKPNTKKKKKNTKKAKTQTNIKLNDKPKKKKKGNKKTNAARDRSKTSNTTPSNLKPSKYIKPEQQTNKTNTIQLNTISHSPPKPPQKPATTKTSKKFPWANWIIDRGDVAATDDEKEDDGPSHRQRRSSLGSIRELHIARAKKAKIKSNVSGKKGGGHREHKKKPPTNTTRHDVDGVDIYNPNAMKQKRRKEKEKHKFKVVPKHHVKRSSLPTYKSIRKNNPQLQFYVKKETQRNLATLLDQPEKRTKSKKLKNLSRAGFDIHVNKRYRLEDGRIGICKFKGRTEFGKSSEDWVGLVMEIGDGEHDGSVQGKTYFRCREGKGLFVRPYDIIECLGSYTKVMSKQDIKLAKQRIKSYKKKGGNGDKLTTSTTVVEKDEDGKMINPDHGYNMMNEKFYNPKTLLDKNKGKKAKKKKHHTQV